MKVSITTTHTEGLAVWARSMPGNPYDGHTLAEALEQAGLRQSASPACQNVCRFGLVRKSACQNGPGAMV
jgi:hypothetical protein